MSQKMSIFKYHLQRTMLVSMHPTEEAARAQQEAEISLLLQSYDEQRMQELRSRMRQMRHRRHPWGRPPRLSPERPMR